MSVLKQNARQGSEQLKVRSLAFRYELCIYSSSLIGTELRQNWNSHVYIAKVTFVKHQVINRLVQNDSQRHAEFIMFQIMYNIQDLNCSIYASADL